MTNTNQNNIAHQFLSEKSFRFWRHLVLIISIGVVTLSFIWYTPLDNIPEYYRFYAWVIYFLVFGIVIYTNIYVLVPRLLLENKLTRYIISLFAFVIILILSILMLQIFLFKKIPQDEFNLLTFLINISSACFILVFLLLGTSSIVLIKYWILADIKRSELAASALQSELKLLKNQINPHFLFNMLNNVNGLLRKDKLQASDTLYKLEELLRYQIQKTPKEKVTLKSEINFIKDYLNLEKIRRDDFSYSVKEDDNCRWLEVPPLLFINFVENAVKYSANLEGVSCVNISFRYVDNKLDFTCENSMSEYPVKSNNTSGLGLNNIRRRLDLLYPNLHHLDIKESNSKYTVKLTIEI